MAPALLGAISIKRYGFGLAISSEAAVLLERVFDS